MTLVADPFEAAAAAEYNPSSTFFGQVQVDCWFAVLEKGQGKIPFDPNRHDAAKRVTAITIDLLLTSNSRANFPVKREMIAESKEWTQIVKPSLVALDVDLRAANGRWAQIELVPTGQKYTGRDGSEKDRTTIKFVRFFGSEEECVTAAADFFGALSDDSSATNGVAATATPNGAASDAEKQTAAKFLRPLWKTCGGDVEKFSELIAKNQLVAKYFDLASPEVVAIVNGN